MNRINETESDFFNFVGFLFRSANSEWIDLIEEELSIDQTTDLEIISMGDLNFDFGINLNKKWHNLIELFNTVSIQTTKPQNPARLKLITFTPPIQKM